MVRDLRPGAASRSGLLLGEDIRVHPLELAGVEHAGPLGEHLPAALGDLVHTAQSETFRVDLDALASFKRRWKVSILALVHRASDLGLIADYRAESLYTQMSKLGYRTQEPPFFEAEDPTLVTEVVRTHLEDLGYTEEQLSAALSLEVDELRQLYLGQRPRLRLAR